MNDYKAAQKEEFQQAKVLAISKTAKSIKSIYSTVLLIFIIAVIIAVISIGTELFSSDNVSSISSKKPPVNEIIHSAVVHKNAPLPLDSNRIDLQNHMVSEDEDIVAINPIDDVVKHEDSLGGFDTKNVDPNVLRGFQDLMNKGIKEFSEYKYQSSLEIFNEARKYKEIWYNEIKRANAYYDMALCMIDIKKEIKPFFEEYRLVKLIPPGEVNELDFEGYIKKDIDLQNVIDTQGKIYFNFLHKADGKFYSLDKNWSFQDFPKDQLKTKIYNHFRVVEQSIRLKIQNEQIHPMDYVNELIKFALSIGNQNGFDSETVAHDYLLDAFELDRFLFETINLYKDKRFYEWLTLIENNVLSKAVTVRKSLQLNYPNAWEFKSENPERAILQKIDDQAELESNVDYDPTSDPEVIKKRANLANKSTREKIHFFTEYAKEAEVKGDEGWAVILKSKASEDEMEDLIRNVIDQWSLAKYWYREAQKLTTDELDSQNLEDKRVKINGKIFWAKKRLR